MQQSSFTPQLTGEIALVTGGTRNIGLAIAEALQSCGAKVCILGSSDSDALETALSQLRKGGQEGLGLLAKVQEEDAVLEVFDQIDQKMGPVSILINGAAARPHEPFTSMTREAWSAVLDVILTGAFLTSREMFRRLPQGKCGAIVNIGGLSAHRPAKDRVHVITAKSGLVGFTRALAQEGLGRIRANCIVPGVIETIRKTDHPLPDFGNTQSPRPSGSCRDVARATLALADPADTYVTGQTLHVNGGLFMP